MLWLKWPNTNCFFLLYISFRLDTNLPGKSITVSLSKKTWVTKELKKIGNRQENKEIAQEVTNEISKAKQTWKEKVELSYSSRDLQQLDRIKSMSSITQRNRNDERKPLKIEGIIDADPLNIWENFHSCFVKHNLSPFRLFLFWLWYQDPADCNQILLPANWVGHPSTDHLLQAA